MERLLEVDWARWSVRRAFTRTACRQPTKATLIALWIYFGLRLFLWGKTYVPGLASLHSYTAKLMVSVGHEGFSLNSPGQLAKNQS